MRRSSSGLCVLTLLLACFSLWSCHDTKKHGDEGEELPGTWEGKCLDADADGFGFQCEKGDDCDDTDPTLTTKCGCAVADAGCACEPGSQPVDCIIDREITDSGGLLCKTGKRYCRDGAYTDCVGVRSFEVPPPSSTGSQSQALIDQDASARICDFCNPDCYKVQDLLDTVSGDPEIALSETGGLTLTPSDGTYTPPSPDIVDTDPPCTPGVIVPQFDQYDNDCDGIPDNYDNVVGMPGKTPPFTTSHVAIAMDLAPGDTGSHTMELSFVLKTVDVYFLLDTTASMDGELAQLIKDLTTGTFLDNPATAANEANAITCASPLGSSTSDASLKSKGIAGNIACLVPNSGFGAGHFREIPFDNPDTTIYPPSTSASRYTHAFDWFIPYEHRQDVSTNVNDTLSALKLFYTAGNTSWPENDIYALYAVATGSQIYAGWDRPGTEARTCKNSSDYFGYPCFRRQAIPVVVLITDASMMNGPDVDIYKNSALSSCITTTSPFTTTTQNCNADSVCEAAHPGQGYFCDFSLASGTLGGKCAVPKSISSACAPDGIPDGKNDDNYRQPNAYVPVQTSTMSKTPDGTYHRVPKNAAGTKDKNEDFTSAVDVGTIDSTFITYVGDTRGMDSDIHRGNLGATCSQWPTTGNAAATSDTTPGYPDAVFQFHVSDPNKTLTISTQGSHHAPTLAIVSTGGAGATSSSTTQLEAPATSDSTPYEFSASDLSGAFDYSVAVDLSSGFTPSWRRSSFGTCMEGSTGATDLAPDAVFAFTPDTDLNDVSFSVGGALVVPTSDTGANASPWKDLGRELGQTLTYYGTTSSSTTSKWTSGQLGSASCRANSTAANREHVFKFTLQSAAQLEIKLAAPSSYDPVLSLFGPNGAAPVSATNVATPLACKHTAGGDDVLTGTYAAGTYYLMVHAYNTTAGTGTYTLTVRELTDEAIVLYDDQPVAPQDVAIEGPLGANSNDNFFSFNLGEIDAQFMMLNNGNTAASTIHADFVPSSFQDAAGTCQSVSGFSNDAVAEFSVDATRRVRIETFDGTGLDPNQSAGFDHVLAVVERPAELNPTVAAVTNNDRTATARVIAASSIPQLVGSYSQFTGATYANSNTITMSESVSPQVMYDVANLESATCSSITTDLQDVVYRFDVDASSAGTYDFDTVGSQSTTYLSLHRGAPDTLTSVTPTLSTRALISTDDTTANSSPTGSQTGLSLGAIDGKTVTYSDTTDATTSNKWVDAQFAGCRVSPANNAAHEHVLSFSVASTSTVTITLAQTAPFDASVALFGVAPVAGSIQTNLKACSRVSGSSSSNPAGFTTAANGVLTGTLTAGTYYVMVHGYQSANNTGSYTLSVADMTTRQSRTVATDNITADGGQAANGVDLGDVKSSMVTYNGATTSSTPNKWAASFAGTANGASNGCRVSAGEDTVHEQVLRFSVSGSTSRTLSLALQRGSSTFDPVLSVLNSTGGALSVGSSLSGRILGCQRAYTATTTLFTGSPALTGAGNAASGGTITGTFAPGTYYAVINGASSASGSGSYTLVITDTTPTSTSASQKWTDNSKDSTLNGSGTGAPSSGDAPYTDFGTLTSAGAAYHGSITSNTPAKWNAYQFGGSGTYNCRSSQNSYYNRAEHVYKVTLPASSTTTVSLAEQFASTSLVLAYYDSLTGTPQINSDLDRPTGCVAANGSDSLTIANSSASDVTYWFFLYPQSASSSNTTPSATGATYTGSYDLTFVLESYGATTATWAANSQNTTLNTSVSAPAPFLDLGHLTTASSVTYQGTTDTSTPTKWTHAQLGSASGRNSTASTENNAVPEHLFRFDTNSTAQNLTISLIGVTSGYDVALSVFQSASVPQTHSTLSTTFAQTSNNNSSSASVSGAYNGTYYILVHGAKNGEYGNYALTIAPTSSASIAQSGGNFSDTVLNPQSITTISSRSFSNLNDANLGNGTAPYGDLGIVSAAQGYTTTAALSTSSKKRWAHGAIATSNSTTWGCRRSSSSAADSNYEQVFKFHLNGALDTTITLQTDITSSDVDAVVSVFGPIGATLGTQAPKTGSSPAAAFNNGNSIGNSSCTHVDVSTGTISGMLAAGDYVVLVHSYDNSNNSQGDYTLTVAPTTSQVPYADFGTLTTSPLSYSGSISSSTLNKWAPSQVAATTAIGTASASNGCRNTSSSYSREHLFKFHLDSRMAVSAKLDTSVGDQSLDGVVSIFGPISSWNIATTGTGSTGVFNGGSALAVSTCDAVGKNTSGAISGVYDPGDYVVLVQGRYQTVDQYGDYKITLTPSSLTSGGNFSDAALDASGLTTSSSSFSGLDGSANPAPYGNFGTVTSSQGYTYTGALSTSTQRRWQPSAVATSNSAQGCRSYWGSGTGSQDSYEHVFKFHLDSALGVTVALDNVTTSGFDTVLSLYGPINSGTWGTNVALKGTSSINTPAEVFNNGSAIATSYCVSAVGSTNANSMSGTIAAGDYLVVVHSYSDSSNKVGSYTLKVGPSTPAYTAPYADFGTLTTTSKVYAGTLSSGTTKKWTSANVANTSYPNGCRSNNTSASYEHAFKFHLDSLSSVTATLNTSTGSSAFNGIVSIFGPIASWGSTTPATAPSSTSTAAQTFNAGTSLTVATCSNVNQSSGSVSGTYEAGDYLVLVQGQDTGDAGKYALTLSAAGAPFSTNSQDTALNATTTATVASFGDLTTTGASYEGSTASATQKWSNTQLGSASCRSTSSTTRDVVPEHVFKFSINTSTNMKMTLHNPGSTGGSWNSALSLYGPYASVTDPSVALAIASPLACNQTTGGDDIINTTLAQGTYYLVVHGNTDAENGTYQLSIQPRTTVTSPSATWADYVMDNTLNGSYLAPVADFGTIGTSALYYKGSTASAASKWTGSQLAASSAQTGTTVAANGCRVSSGTSIGEHVFSFKLTSSKTMTVKVEPTDFDPVLSIFGPLAAKPSVGANVNSSAPSVSSCYHNAVNTGTASNGAGQLSGTWGAGTYYVVVHGYATTASVAGAKPTGTYTLTLDPTVAPSPTARTVTTDNSTAELASPTGATPIDLGTVDNYVTTYTGTTTTSTTSNKWTDAQIRSASTSGTGTSTGCRASAAQDSGREHLLKFTVSKASGLPLRLALMGALDGTLSVYSSAAAPSAGATVSTLLACSHATGTASDATSGTYTAAGGVITGTFPQGTYYAIVHGYAANAVGAYTLKITDDSTSYTSGTVGAGSAAGESGPQGGLNLGVVDGKLLVYAGSTTSAVNKWSQAQVSSAGNTGCRLSGNDSGREHLLKFTVNSARRVAMRLSLPSGATYQPVLSVFNGTAPSVGSAVSGLTACSRVGSTATTSNAVSGDFSASDGLITGTFAAGTYYVMVHGYQATNNQGAYYLSLYDAEPESMGEADNGRRVTIDGNNSTIAFNQWAGSDFPDANGVSAGGRLNGTERTYERLYSFSVAGATKTLTVSLSAQFDSVLSVFDTVPRAISAGGSPLTGHLESNRNSGSFARSITRAFAPGTYYVLVHGYRSNPATTGTYTLAVGDDTWQSGLVACNSRGTSSKLTAVTLTPGSYYLVIKSGAGTGMVAANYRYTLNIRRTFAQPFIACDHEGYGAGTRRSFIETTLEGGKTYAVVVRGVTPSDKGSYGVIIRDLDSGNVPLGCANSAGYASAANNANSFTADLKANRQYYVVVRSNSSSSVGQADVRMAHSSNSMCAFNNVTFDSVGSSTGVSPYVPSKIVTKLPVGDYYAVVKGNQNLYQSSVRIPTGSTAGIPDDRGRGRYQITFGDASLATNNQQFTPPDWGTANSGGALNELNARGIRVITVNSISQHGSADLYMREQSKQISELTHATDINGNAIRKNIGEDGSGMGYAVVDAVAKFANAVQMDITMQLSLSPDDPGLVPPNNRRFEFVARAVPAAMGTSNACGAPFDSNGDGVLDTHTSCGPGATPRFEIMVTNPMGGTCMNGATPGIACDTHEECGTGGACQPPYSKQVPPNPSRTGGGYLMTVQLVGKDKLSNSAAPQIIDEIPLLVVPSNVFPDPDSVFPASGEYEQTVNSVGCMQYETPTWKSLYWEDTLPPGTSVEWSACAGHTDADLVACSGSSWVTIANVVAGSACTTSAECPNAFCNNPSLGTATGTCESAIGGACTADDDCGRGASCVSNKCNYTSNPKTEGIDLKLPTELFGDKTRVRVRATLKSNSSHTLAPTIHNYRVDYTCARNE